MHTITEPQESEEYLPKSCKRCGGSGPCKKNSRDVFCSVSAGNDAGAWVPRAEAEECPGAERRAAFYQIPK